MGDRLTLSAFRAAWWLLPRLPESVAIAVFNALADLAWIHNGSDVQRLQRNLGRVTGMPFEEPALRDLTRAAMRSYAKYWRETFTLDAWSIDEIASRVRLVGREYLDEPLQAGRGVVIAATHSGNWDLAGVLISAVYGGGTTVAERLKPEALFETFVRARQKYGIEIVPHTGGPRPAFAVLLERARAGRLVALVSDRDLSKRGVEVEFFGAPARMAAGPAALALATGVPVVPVGIWNDGETVVFEAHEPLAVVEGDTVATLTQRLAERYETIIAAHPVDWHMLQRVWVDAKDAQ